MQECNTGQLLASAANYIWTKWHSVLKYYAALKWLIYPPPLQAPPTTWFAMRFVRDYTAAHQPHTLADKSRVASTRWRKRFRGHRKDEISIRMLADAQGCTKLARKVLLDLTRGNGLSPKMA